MANELKQTNISLVWLIISTITILFGIGVGWGETHAEVVALRADQCRVEGRLDALETVVRQHHDDTDRHVDKTFKEDVMKQFAEVRAMIMAHAQGRMPRGE